MIRIAFVLNSISGGGIARVVTTYANELSKDPDLSISLILLHKKDHFYNTNNIELIENPNLRSELSKSNYIIKTFLFLRKSLIKYKFNIIISNGEWINSFVFFSSLGVKKKLFFADHSNPKRAKQAPFSFLEKFTYKRVCGVLVLSDTAYEKVKNKFGQLNVKLVNNPVTMLDARNIKKENIVICMGRLSQEKGQDILIKAFSYLKDEEWKLQLLGNGENREELEKLVRELNISNTVEFLGNQQDIEYYLSRAKIYVMPSLTENFPMALIESMSIGLPCVVTNCMPWRKIDDFIIDGINGIKVPVNDPKALAEGIQKLIQSEELRTQYSQAALSIRSKFDMDKNVDAFKRAINL